VLLGLKLFEYRTVGCERQRRRNYSCCRQQLNAFIPATQVNAQRMTNRLNRP